MYSVSNEYLTAMNENVQSGYISGTIDGVDFSPNDVLIGSASVSNKCVDPSNICLGGVNIGVLKITFVNTSLVTRGSWEGKEIVVNWSQLIDDENQTFETIPVGVYIISEANHAAEGVVVTAYDRMSLLDKELNFTTSSGSVYALLTLCADECGVVLGMTRPQIEALPNGEEVFSIYPDNDMKTFRNLLGYIAACCGSFATFNRSGQLILKQFAGLPIMNISADKRMKGGAFSDFKTFYTSVSVLDISTQTEEVEKNYPDNGLKMELGANPLLQYGLVESKRRQRRAILESLRDFKYTPFTTLLLGNPIFDLGDVFNFTNGIAGTTSKGCLMEYTYIFNRSYNMTGYGKNPALLGVISKADRQSTMNARTSASNEFQFLKYTNAEELTIRQGFKDDVGTQPASPVKILLATFSINTIKETNIEIDFKMSPWNFKPSHSRNTTSYFYFIASFWGVIYELDEEEIARNIGFSMSPILEYDAQQNAYYWAQLFTNLAENLKQVSLLFEDHQTIMNLGANEQKTLKVYGYFVDGFSKWDNVTPAPEIVKGLYTFAAGSIDITVKGQGLAKEDRWNGYIYLDDEVGLQVYSTIEPDEIEDNVVASILDVESVDLTDDISEGEYATNEPVEIAENYTITFVKPKRNIISIHGDNLVNIDETENITTI